MIFMFMSIPALIKILVSLGSILVFNKLVRSLPLGIFAGTVILAFWSGHTFSSLLTVLSDYLISADTWMLVLAVTLVITASSLMAETGVMRELVWGVRSYFSSRIAMALLPAIIGLLPMPGGALFSAPMVGDCDPEKIVAADRKTLVNYWFRHVWEFWWPLYPGVIVAIDLSGLEIWQFVLFQLPLTLFMIVFGFVFFLSPIKKEKKERTGTPAYLLKLVKPVLFIVLAYVLMQILVPAAGRLNKYLPMCIAVTAGIVFIQFSARPNAAAWKKTMLSPKIASMIFIVWEIRLYGELIGSSLPNCAETLIQSVRTELVSAGIPVILLIVFIPLVSGLTTGLSVGFVGASFPIIMQLVGRDAETGRIAAALVLGFVSGYVGMLLSPVHVCLIVTNRHFGTGVEKSIVRLLMPAFSVLLAGFLWSRFLSAVG